MHKGKLRELLKEVTHLAQLGCHTEALIKIAVALDLYDVTKALVHLDQIQTLERELPRSLEQYRAGLLRRIMAVAKERYGHDVSNKLLGALNKNGVES